MSICDSARQWQWKRQKEPKLIFKIKNHKYTIFLALCTVPPPPLASLIQ